MLTEKQMLNAATAFVMINVLEANTNLNYIERLALAVKVMDCDEETFKIFTAMFDNKKVCSIMIKWIDAHY